MKSFLMLVLIGGCLGPVAQAAEPGVKPLGAYPFLLPGLPGSHEAKPKILLWCHGIKLVGVVVGDEGHGNGGGPAQSRAGHTAFLLRDGRCERDGSRVSFGFLVPMKAWVYESAAGGRHLEERTTWLLDRFEGSVQAGQLRGVLVQVDVNHPGYSFQKHTIEAEALAEAQSSFVDESGWRDSVARSFSLAPNEP